MVRMLYKDTLVVLIIDFVIKHQVAEAWSIAKLH